MWLFSRKQKKDDASLLSAYRQSGDSALVGDLFERHVRSVYGACLFYLRDKAHAQDAVMQVFEKLLTELKNTEVRNFKGWLSFVVRNHCINELRRTKSQRLASESWLEFELSAPDAATEQRLADVRDDALLDHLREELPHLKDQQRRCLELFYLQNRSYLEISNQTGLPVNAVKSAIQNGKRNLKLRLEEKLRTNKHAE